MLPETAAATAAAGRYVRKHALCQFLDCGPSFVRALVRQRKLTPLRLSARLTLYDLREAQALIEAARGKDGAQ